MTKTLYISGPMRGIPEFNYPAFFRMAEHLRDVGFNVVNPAELDQKAGVPTDELNIHDVPYSMLKDFIKRDLNAILELEPGVDGIVMLNGWENSKGAKAELALAEFLNLNVYLESTIWAASRANILSAETI